MYNTGFVASTVAGAILFLVCTIAWVTHAIWIINALASSVGATTGQIVLGILGVVVPPIGVIHGVILLVG